MIKFSDYLKSIEATHKVLLKKDTRRIYISEWLRVVSESLKFFRIHYPDFYKSIEKNLKVGVNRWIATFLENPWELYEVSVKIGQLDEGIKYIYEKLLEYAVSNSKANPLAPTKPYPYPSKHPGVSVCAYIVGSQGIYLDLEAHDSLQIKAKRKGNSKEIQCEIKEGLESDSCLLSGKSKQFIMANLSTFHAEYYWFTIQFPKLIEYIKEYKSLFLPLNKKDSFALSQISSIPRLEFIQTSSPCKDCQAFFKELREQLNILKIWVPIIIYSNSPYNTAEVDISPIAVIEEDGNYCNTGLAAKLSYYTNIQKQMINNSMNLRLFCDGQQAFADLEGIANRYMLNLIQSPDYIKQLFINSLYFNNEDVVINWNTFCWLDWFFNCLGKALPHQYHLTLDSPQSVSENWEDFRARRGTDENDFFDQPQGNVNQSLNRKFNSLMYGRSAPHSPLRYLPFFHKPLGFRCLDIVTRGHIRESLVIEKDYLLWAQKNRTLEQDESNILQRLETDFEAVVEEDFTDMRQRI